jgi:hypothetical protein
MKFLAGFFVILAISCARKMSNETRSDASNFAASSEAVPACIQKKIDSIKAQPVWNPPAEIDEYEYDGRKVYLVSAPCCDFFNTVVDVNCNQLCAPSGGFTGKGDGKCRDFFQQAKHIRQVWKDERGKK